MDPKRSAPAGGPRPRLRDRLAASPGDEPGEVLELFLAWVRDTGLDPYPHQEQALLELMAGHHVVLGTPTGSGKSLVALGLHARALCEGRRSFYAAPTKALVNEKFFALCEELGPEQVGMLTGDASINHAAPVICCTAEVLANMALRQGEATDAPYAVLDEFHYYGDRERGMAWQIPLLCLPQTLFLLMSATLGNTARIAERLEARSGRRVVTVTSEDRPVPLSFEYRETPLHESVEHLLELNQAPVYIVHFTQRECAEQAQALLSARISTRDERRRLAAELDRVSFDSPYGKDMRRFLRAGIGVHHAGLLPRYRLLVEQLAQRGLLKVICGTDTLGVGVNIPIRTVLFSRFCKFDGEKTALLGVREFKQIAGRAGRKGFDERGYVVCQAPGHVIENQRAAARARGRRGRAKPRKRPPRGLVPWSRDTFERWIDRSPEPLESRFAIDHGLLVNVLQREGEGDPAGSGYRALLELIEVCHAGEAGRRRLRRAAARHFRSLRRAGIVRILRDPPRVFVDTELQKEFSLHHTLSLYLVDAIWALDPADPDYALDLLSVVEAILEGPAVVLRQQQRRARDELLAQLRAEGVPYEERIERLREVGYPQPLADFVDASFRLFAEKHPWLGEEGIQPKSIAREMFEQMSPFDAYVRRYGLARSEGVLLRYLSQVYGTLQRNVPESAKSEEAYEMIGFFRDTVARVDSSLLDEWESRVRAPTPTRPEAPPAERQRAIDPRLVAARVRAQLHGLVGSLARRDYAEAAGWLHADAEPVWDAERLEAALAPYYAEYPAIVFDPAARGGRFTRLDRTGPRSGAFTQVLVDPRQDNMWFLEGDFEVDDEDSLEGPLLRLRRIGC